MHFSRASPAQLVPHPILPTAFRAKRYWTCTFPRPLHRPCPWSRIMESVLIPIVTCSTTSPSSKDPRTFSTFWHATIGCVSFSFELRGVKFASSSAQSGARWPTHTGTSMIQTRESWWYPAPSALPRLSSPSTRTCAGVWGQADCRTFCFTRVPLGWRGRSLSTNVDLRPLGWWWTVRNTCWRGRRRAFPRRGLNLLPLKNKC